MLLFFGFWASLIDAPGWLAFWTGLALISGARAGWFLLLLLSLGLAGWSGPAAFLLFVFWALKVVPPSRRMGRRA